MKNCNNCIHNSCCYYLMQEKKNSNHIEADNTVEVACIDFKDKKQFIPVDISALSKLKKRIEVQIEKLQVKRNRFEKKEGILIPHGFRLDEYEHTELVYIQGQISALKKELEDLDKIFPVEK